MKILICGVAALLVICIMGCGDLPDREPTDYPPSSGPRCKTGKPCGDSCIARDKTCRQ